MIRFILLFLGIGMASDAKSLHDDSSPLVNVARASVILNTILLTPIGAVLFTIWVVLWLQGINTPNIVDSAVLAYPFFAGLMGMAGAWLVLRDYYRLALILNWLPMIPVFIIILYYIEYFIGVHTGLFA